MHLFFDLYTVYEGLKRKGTADINQGMGPGGFKKKGTGTGGGKSRDDEKDKNQLNYSEILKSMDWRQMTDNLSEVIHKYHNLKKKFSAFFKILWEIIFSLCEEI
jgi:hypothetical protein